MPPFDLRRARVVLVEPRYGGNIGQCARAMLNTGFSRLVLVAPREHLTPEAYWMARDARGILESAEVVPTLADALAPVGLAIGTTRRTGKYRRPFLTPREAAESLLPRLAANDVALVFGREDNGLSGSELDLCQWLVSIPASPDFPSLNLAQAVLLCCWETWVAAGAARSPGECAPGEDERRLAGPAELERFYRHLEEVLEEIGFLVGDQAPSILRTLRRIFGRADLDPRDLKILQGILAQMDWYRKNAVTPPAGRKR